MRKGKGGKEVSRNVLPSDKTDLKILHANVQGYSSKQASVEAIIRDKTPDVYCLNETSLKGKRKVIVPNYFSYCKNHDKHMGGVATLVSQSLRPHTVRVAEGRKGDEYIITRLDHISPPINIINIYGDQEKADKEIGRKEKVLESWNRLLQDLKEIESRKEHLLILGDLNRKVGTGILGIEGNNPNISFGGQLVRDLLATSKYVLLNNLPVATGAMDLG